MNSRLIDSPRPVPPNWRLVRAVSLLEGFENDVQLAGGYADPGIGHGKGNRAPRGVPLPGARAHSSAAGAMCSDTPPCRVNLKAFASRFFRHLLQPACVGLERGGQALVEGDREGKPLVLGHLPEIAFQVVAQLGEAHRDEIEVSDRAGLDAREVEDVVDEMQQVHAGVVDRACELHLLRLQVAARVVGEQLRQDQQAVQRRAQLVRHAREKLGFRLARPLRRRHRVAQRLLRLLAPREVARDLREAAQASRVSSRSAVMIALAQKRDPSLRARQPSSS